MYTITAIIYNLYCNYCGACRVIGTLKVLNDSELPTYEQVLTY